MKLQTLHYSCLLSAPCEEVFSFHTDTRNLPLITPSWMNVIIIAMEDPMVEKSRVLLDIKRFALTTRWEMEIEKLSFPDTIIDSMIQGPFSFFRHQRHFIPLEEGETLMRETLSFILPLGWVGNLFFALIKRDMDRMFAHRHKATQNYFLEGKNR